MYCPSLPPDPPSNQKSQLFQIFKFLKFSIFKIFDFSLFTSISTYLLRSHPLISQAGVQNHESRLVLFSQGRTVIVLFSQGSIVQLIIANDQQSIYSRNGWKHKRVNFLLKFSPAITNNLSTKPLTIFTQISLKQSTAFRQLWFAYFPSNTLSCQQYVFLKSPKPFSIQLVSRPGSDKTASCCVAEPGLAASWPSPEDPVISLVS